MEFAVSVGAVLSRKTELERAAKIRSRRAEFVRLETYEIRMM